MKRIGEILKDARIGRRYSVDKIEEITKIKSTFINAIEREKWENLPPFPTVLGFVKSFAAAVGIDEKMATSVLKRDYPPKKLNINPKPDAVPKFVWSPRLTFAIGVSATLVLIVGYLIFQYWRFISPPRLTVVSPKEGQAVTGNSVQVFGTTAPDAKITVNSQPVLVADDGKFSVNIEITPETTKIIVKAVSRTGKETEISRTIQIAK